MKEFTGGRESAIYHHEEVVYRPLNPWSHTVHQLLNHYVAVGLKQCPRFIAIEDDKEVLSFVSGDTYNYPLVGAIASQNALISASKLLRKLHDASESFIAEYSLQSFTWMIAPRPPFEVICHGDFTPYNVALSSDEVVGVFDFDTAHPAPRIWDLAYSIYCWAPFKTDKNDQLGSLEDQIVRAKLFCDSYGATTHHRSALVYSMIERLEALVDFMLKQAEQGNTQFQSHIEQGHHLAYLTDIEYLKQHQLRITQGIRLR
ncbi:phosphotransferase [Vibrio taketomensis]|uniref:phosphotransferase n=1 Tax=Vibrio taketomensis TaxID=2572923 RepID=UPI001389D15C|nr:aminoglycoside phosphotransferase family protein [Vibrio taketomensis]